MSLNLSKKKNNALHSLRGKEETKKEDKEYYNKFIKLWQDKKAKKGLGDTIEQITTANRN